MCLCVCVSVCLCVCVSVCVCLSMTMTVTRIHAQHTSIIKEQPNNSANSSSRGNSSLLAWSVCLSVCYSFGATHFPAVSLTAFMSNERFLHTPIQQHRCASGIRCLAQKSWLQ